jgi:hypothetical protein
MELKMININNKESMINEIMDTACIAYRIYLKTCSKSSELIDENFVIEYPKYSMDISNGNKYKNENMRFYKEGALLKVLFSIKEELTKMENQYTEVLKKLFAERKKFVRQGHGLTRQALMTLAHKKTKKLLAENTDCNYQVTFSLVLKRLYEFIRIDDNVRKKNIIEKQKLKTQGDFIHRLMNMFEVITNERPRIGFKNWKNKRIYITFKSNNHNHQLFINLLNNNVICTSKSSFMYDMARYIDKHVNIAIDCAK